MRSLSQLLSKVTVTCCNFYINVQCVRLAARRRTKKIKACSHVRMSLS